MTDAVWRSVVGFEGLYEVSSDGKVRSLPRRIAVNSKPHQPSRHIHGRMLAQKLNKPSSGYTRPHVSLWKENKEYTCKVSRLVAEAFLPRHEGADQVLHLNDNPMDNRAENLQWGTHAENVRQAVERRRYRHGDQHHASRLTDEERLSALARMQARESLRSIGRDLGVSHQMLSDLRLGKVKGHPRATVCNTAAGVIQTGSKP